MADDRGTTHALYKKLIGLYPRAFRERVGESMVQTFDDLWNERKQQAEGRLSSFLFWMFVETAIGIVRERIVSVKEMNPMQNILANLRLPAMLGFLIILPFILLEFTFVIGKGLKFDLRDFLDSIVTFGVLWLGAAAILLILTPLVRTLRAGNTVRPEPAQGNAPTNILTHPTSALIISFLLALPFVTLLSLLILGIEPPLGPLEPLLKNSDPDQPNVIGTIVVVGAFSLAVAGCLIARAPIVRTLQAGGGLFAHPMNLILAVVVLSSITMLVVGLIVDQYPCWIGLPNCD